MTSAAHPQLSPGTWAIDSTHSTIGFTVRHLMVSKVRGRFQNFGGTIVVDETGSSSIQADIDVASITTDNAQRDGHLKTGDYFEVEEYPTATFRSTTVVAKASGEYVMTGDFTLHGITKSVDLVVAFNGVNPGIGRGTVAGFEATTTINRKDFGINLDTPLEGGGTVVGDKIALSIEIEARYEA